MEVRVLGPLELVDGASVVPLAPAERTLLAALAARVGARVSAEALEEALWPARLPPSARKTLQGHVLRLRRVLGSSAIVERSGGYRLDPDQLEVDARRTTMLVTEARDAIGHGKPVDAIALLGEAMASFRGDPYEDVPDSALPAGEVHRLEELRAAVVEESVEAELACGRGQRCIADLETFLEHHPYRERAWGQLMLAQYQAGRPADALGTYGRARSLLAAELGLEPGPTLRDLEHAILTHDPRLLRAVAVGDGLGRSNLPAGLSPIIGRESELAGLDRLGQDNRLITLTGTGGIGKTRLAVELAARSIGRYDHGPFFVDLAPIGDVTLVPAALAAALGVVIDAPDDVINRVRASLDDHQVVLVVDNCEHLLPEIAGLVGGLLGSNPGVRVIATSREPLDVAGERVCSVDPLDVPPATPSLEQIQESESGALFLARLPANVASRSLSVDDCLAVGAICRSLEGIPLGLELAAARSRALSLPELADLLVDSIGELALPGHGIPARHRTMRAALDWGFQLLSAPAQTALRSMSVFAGGCELPAFAAVCLDDEDLAPLDVMDELVRTSFVAADVTSNPTRYRLLEPVRQFARGHLEDTGDPEDRHRRHLEFYLGLARTLKDAEAQPGYRVDGLRIELGNIRVALDWAAQQGHPEAGLLLASELYYLWSDGIHNVEGVSRVVGLLRNGGGSPDARSAAARVAAIVASNLGECEQALVLCEQALDEALASGDKIQEGRARQVLSQLVLERGDIPAARRYLAPALRTHADQAHNVYAFCIVTQAQIDCDTAALDDAAAGVQALLVGRFGSIPYIGSAARFVLGQVMFERGDHSLARSWYTDLLAFAERSGYHAAVIDAHLDLVGVECATGSIDDASAHLGVALKLRQDGERGWELGILLARTSLALHGGYALEAVALAEAALAMSNQMSMARNRCLSLRFLGDARLAIDRPDASLAAFEELIARAAAVPYPCRVAEGHEGAAAASRALGHGQAARRHLDSAAEIRRRTGTRRLPRPAVEGHLRALEADCGSVASARSGIDVSNRVRLAGSR